MSNATRPRSEEHTSELQSRFDLVCRLLLEKKKHGRQHPANLRTPYFPLTRQAAVPSSLRHRYWRAHRGFFFHDTATTEIYTLSLHDALPIYLKFEAGFQAFSLCFLYDLLIDASEFQVSACLFPASPLSSSQGWNLCL